MAASPALDRRITHLLNRFAFGPSARDRTHLLSMGDAGLARWFTDQIERKTPDTSLDRRLSKLRSLSASTAQLHAQFPTKKQRARGEGDMESDGAPRDMLKELVLQKILRAVESTWQMEEVMTDFWFNHFNVSFEKGPVKYFITAYEREVIRPRVFGKFRDLLLATAQSPAMLFYLDNAKSVAGEINENYAREILELHTLGVDGGYTQKDIQEAARVLTGWAIAKPKLGAGFRFAKKKHDFGPKTVMTLKFSGQEGEAEGVRLIDHLASHPSTARFIARKLAVKFISDHPSDATVKHLAEVFSRSGGDLKSVYSAIFNSPEFWAESTMGAKIKTPFELMTSAVRALDGRIEPTEERVNQLNQFLVQTGQPVYRCAPPTGFKAVSEAWVSSGALVSRINFALKLTNHSYPQLTYSPETLTALLGADSFKSSLELFQTMNHKLMSGIVSEKTLEKLASHVEHDLSEDEAGQKVSLMHFPFTKMAGLLLSTPEFQRR